MNDRVSKSDEDWQKQLSPEQFQITRRQGTERPFSGTYHDCKTPGIYRCVCCDAALFHSDNKYDSGSGWPSYWQPITENAIRTREDTSHGMHRVEVLCASCDAHLGHRFEDGPQPTGLRYCINSIALNLKAK